MSEPIDEWTAMPITLTVEDAARVLRIGRSKAYEMAKQYAASGGTEGLPCLRLGDLLRVPKFALHEYVTTGRVVQLIPQTNANATPDATASRKPARNSHTILLTQRLHLRAQLLDRTRRNRPTRFGRRGLLQPVVQRHPLHRQLRSEALTRLLTRLVRPDLLERCGS